MIDRIDELFKLCRKHPFDTEEIQCFIKRNDMSNAEVTSAALKLCDYGMFSYSDYLYQYEKEPDPRELRTYDWERLFNVLIDNGLNASLVICDDGGHSENVLQSLRNFDDGDLGARILRNILSKGISPNIKIEDIAFFEEVDEELMMDIDLGLYEQKWQLDNAIRFWLVLVGFGGVINGDGMPVEMYENYSPQIFREFERFDYVINYSKNDFELTIIERETNLPVATA